jgi:DNA-binding MltR family transcriptional regulator
MWKNLLVRQHGGETEATINPLFSKNAVHVKQDCNVHSVVNPVFINSGPYYKIYIEYWIQEN